MSLKLPGSSRNDACEKTKNRLTELADDDPFRDDLSVSGTSDNEGDNEPECNRSAKESPRKTLKVNPGDLMLHIEVRGFEFDMNCRRGWQTFKWLGFVTRSRFSSFLGRDEREFAVDNVTNEAGASMFPSERIRERCEAFQTLHVSLRDAYGQRSDPHMTAPKLSLWELWASASDDQFRTQKIVFDMSKFPELCEEDGSEGVDNQEKSSAPSASSSTSIPIVSKPKLKTKFVPYIGGNFNNWGLPVRMRVSPHANLHYTLDVLIPKDVDLMFDFVVNLLEDEQSLACNGENHGNTGSAKNEGEEDSSAVGEGEEQRPSVALDTDSLVHFVSEKYEIVNEADGSRYNVCRATSNEKEENAKGDAPSGAAMSFCSSVSAMMQLRTLLKRVRLTKRATSGDPSVSSSKNAFAGVRRPTHEQWKCLFDIDWTGVQLTELAPDAQERDAIREKVFEFYEPLCTVFEYYASLTGPDFRYMSIQNFTRCAKECQLITKRLTMARVHEIFMSVNVEESFDDVRRADGVSETVRTIGDDPDNPNNLFLRSEFLESVLRLSTLETRGEGSVVDGLASILEAHFVPRARDIAHHNRARDRLLESDVQEYWTKERKLFARAFKKVARIEEKRTGPSKVPHVSSRVFVEVMQQCTGLLGGGELSVRSIQGVFAVSQDMNKSGDGNKLLFMHFEEFFEAVARIAEIRYAKDPALSYVGKLKKVWTLIFLLLKVQ